MKRICFFTIIWYYLLSGNSIFSQLTRFEIEDYLINHINYISNSKIDSINIYRNNKLSHIYTINKENENHIFSSWYVDNGLIIPGKKISFNKEFEIQSIQILFHEQGIIISDTKKITSSYDKYDNLLIEEMFTGSECREIKKFYYSNDLLCLILVAIFQNEVELSEVNFALSYYSLGVKLR